MTKEEAIKLYGRIDYNPEEAEKITGYTRKTLAVYANRAGIAKNSIFDLFENEYFKSILSPNLMHYKISNYGRVINQKGSLLKSSPHHQTGYLQIRLVDDKGKKVTPLVHLLVYDTFIGKDREGKQVDHIDGNRQNCKADNLQLLSIEENRKKQKRPLNQSKKFTEDEVVEICNLLNQGLSYTEISNISSKYVKHRVEKIKQKQSYVYISNKHLL